MNDFQDVPEEVESMEGTGIFDISYTHVTSHLARPGVEKTGKLMAPRLALANGVVPFSGEPELFHGFTYLFKAYHVSVSSYPHAKERHNWRRYLRHGMFAWTPKASELVVEELERIKGETVERPYSIDDFEGGKKRENLIISIDGCIEIERIRRETYERLGEFERAQIATPKPEAYVFGESLGSILSPDIIFGRHVRVAHPFVPGEINLKRHLTGIFTSLEVDETRRWIARVLGKDIPVASLNALDTWEKRK